MSSIVKEICEWGSKLPYWEQAALEKIFAGVEITEDVLRELLQYLLEDADLTLEKGDRPILRFPKMTFDDENVIGNGSIRLRKLSNLCNINALVPNQTLEFNDQLTVIFGSNGSGKSGYARVIASAAFTRGDKQVLHDITKPIEVNDRLSATIGLDIEGEPVNIPYEIGNVCPEMRSFYVFDSTSVRAHLTHSNPMSFSPAGLEYLTRLVEMTDGVRRHLQLRIDQLTYDNPFLINFTGGKTVVSELINSLSANTDVEAIKILGKISEEEKDQIHEFDLKIAQLISANIPQLIETLEQSIKDLDILARNLKDLGDNLSEQKVTQIFQSINNLESAAQFKLSLGSEQFENPWFQGTGTHTWHDFIEAAYNLSLLETNDNASYPEPDSRCLLCLQPLNTEAHDRLHSLWTYMKSDAQLRLDAANKEVTEYLKLLQRIDFDFLNNQAVSNRHLQDKEPQTLQKAQQFIQKASNRKDILIQSIINHEIGDIKPLPENCVREIDQIIGRLSEKCDELVNLNVEEEIQRLRQEKLELEHRYLLASMMDEVIKYVENACWIETASSPRIKRSSAHISRKYNELFDRLVTQEYIRLFEDTMRKLNCPYVVEIVTRAQKGTTIKQLQMKTDESISPDQAPMDKVLSEGEQRAVALADFFTEVRLDNQSSGVVLDDPVSSLDFQWKETIAEHIVEEACRQQVIVFTHDLHFLYILSKLADSQKIKLASHWIEKRNELPGYIFLNNCPSVEANYKSTHFPQEIYIQANDPANDPQLRERLLKEGFGALRTCYEVLVIYELFNGVVLRFDEQIRIQNLKEVVITKEIVEEIVKKVAYLSRFIEGHSHSDLSSATKPTPKMLLNEIDDFNIIKHQIKEIRKEGKL
jgi:ABC-type Na+ transport system ATPase subunit NatA